MKKHSQKCKHDECDFQNIQGSEKCWIHSEDKLIEEALKLLKGDENDVYISDVDFSGHVFRDISFNKLVVSDASIKDVKFINCKFLHSGFLYSSLDNITFENCSFDDVEWTSSFIQSDSKFISCSFIDNNFSSCRFLEISQFIDLNFEETNFVTCDFFEIKVMENTVFNNCLLSESVFNEVNSDGIRFENCDFIHSQFYNSNFINSYFYNVKNSFENGAYPRLCDFSGFKFMNMVFPDEFYIWNNVDEDKVEFYTRIISMVENENHPNHLQELNDSIDKLYELGLESSPKLINKVRSIYHDKIELFGRDFSTLGNIFRLIHELPKNIRPQGRLSLPMKEDKLESSKIRIRIKCDDWSVKNIAQFQNELLKINNAFDKPLIVESIEKGSLIQTLTGDLDIIIAVGTLLGSFATTVFAVIKGKLYLEKSILENKKLRFEVEHQEEEFNRNALKTDLANKSAKLILLDNEKDVKERTLKKIKEIGTEHIPNFNEIIEGEIGDVVNKRLPVINKKFPLEEVEVFINIFPKSIIDI